MKTLRRRKDNKLYNVIQFSNAKQAFLFVAKQSILYLPAVQNDDWFRTGEIHQEVKETAFHLNDEIIRKIITVKDTPVISVQLIDNKAYFK